MAVRARAWNLAVDDALRRAVTAAAARESAREGRTVSVSEWVRTACHERLEREQDRARERRQKGSA